MKTRLVWIALLSLCLALPTVGSEPQWSVTLYDLGLNALVELSPSGKTITELPDIGYRPREPFEDTPRWYTDFVTSVKMTDDRRYLVSFVQRTEPYVREAIITDLTTMAIIPVVIPPLEDDEFFVSYHFGAFNPEMTEIALPYVSHDATSGFGCCDSGGIVIVELATGTITHRIDIDAIFNRSTAWLDNWTADGIWFFPRCSACTPPNTYTYLIWNPYTDTVLITDTFHDHQYAERLAVAGELLYSESLSTFPLGGAFPRRLNVVSLYQPGDYPPDVDGQIVYYDGENLDFDTRAHWIMGGQAFLVTNRQHNVVVFRDGHQLTLDYASEEYFIAMTGDGWLTIDRATNEIHHYTPTNEIITGQTLYVASGEIVVANIQWIPPAAELPPFAVDISPPDIVFCPGALPSRLQPGDWAEVIADHQESIIGSLMIGDVAFADVSYANLEALPLGAQVKILDGPVCTTTDGWSYVKVAYQDRIGWLLEVYQANYFLAPVSPTDEDLSGETIGE